MITNCYQLLNRWTSILVVCKCITLASIWEDVDPKCRDLICSLLCPSETRLTPEKALKHPWILENTKNSLIIPKMPSKLMENLKSFKNAKNLKKAVLTFIATQLSSKEVEPLRTIFNSLDKNRDGKLSCKEIKEGLKGHVNENDLITIMKNIDTDKNGYVEYNEFLSAAMGEEISHYETRLESAFNLIDRDGNGKISVRELKSMLKGDVNKTEADFWINIIKEADKNGDGELDFEEFMAIMKETDEK